MALVEYYLDSGAGIIILNDGDAGNRLNTESLARLEKILVQLNKDSSVRIIFLRSNGKNFCLGMDLQKLAESKDLSLLKDTVQAYSRILDLLYNSAKITVCLADGPVKAGGVGIACACDMIFCSEKADFELSESIFGLLPANVLPYLYMLRLSPQTAKYLVLTAQKINAEKALRIGLVDEVFESLEYEKKVRVMTRQLMRISPDAVQNYKKLSADFLDESFNDRKKQAVDTLVGLLGREEIINTVKDFNEGITPSWFARFKPERSVTGEEK